MGKELAQTTAPVIAAKIGPHTTPEACLKRADELYKHDGNWQEALSVLHVGLQNRKTKSNMIILEKLMVLMIDICAEKLTTLHLKEDIGYFRNLCQYQSMNLLEKVLTYLRNKCERVFLDLEKEYGQQNLMKFLSDTQEVQQGQVNDMDATSDELIFLAYTSLDYLEEKHRVQPRAAFFLDICKNILDTLRSNSKLLEFYNDTARKIFAFCKKYRCKKEYRRISETLHSHFNQILKLDRAPEQNSKIPYPIKLDEEDQVTQVLKLRKEQLELALHMEEWTDAHRTSSNIYQLMSKISKKKSEQQIKEIYSEFFDHLSSIFWESELYLFHTYALQNIQFLVKAMKNQKLDAKRAINDKYVLAALSIPLNNRLNNFERLQFNYIPASMKEFDEGNLLAREELLATAKMLHVEGFPSRDSVVHYIKIENIHTNTNKYVNQLFDLIESEESPFVISKQGSAALDALCEEQPNFIKYKPFVAKTLSVRILQKCKSFYRNMKLSKLQKMLKFYNSMTDIEKLLYECNREGLVHTTINYHSNSLEEGSLNFSMEAQVAENLYAFGDQLKVAFQKVIEATTHGKTQRQRIFMKVKEKLDEEVNQMQRQKQEMLAIQQQLADQKQKDKLEQERQKIAEAARKTREQEEQKVRDDQRRARNALLEDLEKERKKRSLEILNILSVKGFKKVGKYRIKDMEDNNDRIDYVVVIDFYQNVLRKEREQIEEDKKKKLREVELWNRAVREEEKIAIEKYAEEHGDKEMEEIQASIQEKQEKELKEKQALENAKPFVEAYMQKQMEKRKQDWEQRKKEFLISKMEELKQSIIVHASGELQKDVNKQIIAQKAVERAARDKAIAEKERAAGGLVSEITATNEGGQNDGWGRGTSKRMEATDSPPKKIDRGGDDGFAIRRSDKPRVMGEESKVGGFRRGPPREDNANDATGFSRGNFTLRKEEKTDDAPKRPARTFGGGGGNSGDNTGFGFRNTNARRGGAGRK